MPDRLRKTKIVATIGPAADEAGVLEAMIDAGIDVARLNASHGDVETLGRRLAAVRRAAAARSRHVAVLLDLPGPKIRVGEVAAGTTLHTGERFTLAAHECEGNTECATITYEGLAGDVSEGDRILLDDGALELSVLSAGDGSVLTQVVRGGPLLSNKGVNVPGVPLGVGSVTPHDIELLEWGLANGVDLVAQSFVRSAADVRSLRDAMGDRPVPLIAKIEKYEALEDLEAIVATADAVMVARGDLAVETSPEAVPPAQKRIVSECRSAGIPVVVATQMLESMTDAPRPTRAEASDVATAVFEGADAVMLSEETAVGHFPVEAVETMARVCRSAEDVGPPEPVCRPSGSDTSAVAAAACDLAADIGATAIITPTETGTTARAVASCRPSVPVIGITSVATVGRAMSLVWNVSPQVLPAPRSIEEMTQMSLKAARDSGIVHEGDRIVLTAGTSVGRSGGTDLVRVLTA